MFVCPTDSELRFYGCSHPCLGKFHIDPVVVLDYFVFGSKFVNGLKLIFYPFKDPLDACGAAANTLKGRKYKEIQ